MAGILGGSYAKGFSTQGGGNSFMAVRGVRGEIEESYRFPKEIPIARDV
jgi:hypothetical protein